MLTLGIDTSTHLGTTSVYSGTNGVLSEVNIKVVLNHSNTIMTAVNNAVELSGIKKDEIKLIAIGVGPGSFTGIRVGMGVAKGMAYSMGIPIIGVNTLDILANAGNYHDCRIISMIDARKGRVYYAVYEKKDGVIERTSDYKDGNVELILELMNEKTILIGDGAYKNREYFINNGIKTAAIPEDDSHYPRASVLCRIAAKNYESGKREDVHLIEPIYINKSQAERLKYEK